MPVAVANDVFTYKWIPQLHIVYMYYVHVNRPTNDQIHNPASKIETILQNLPDQTDGDFACYELHKAAAIEICVSK